jgi:hypothetical protein
VILRKALVSLGRVYDFVSRSDRDLELRLLNGAAQALELVDA